MTSNIFRSLNQKINLTPLDVLPCQPLSNNQSTVNPNQIYEYEPKNQMVHEVESCMPLYLDSEWIDCEYLNTCYDQLKSQIQDSEVRGDLVKLNFIQERLQVLVYQNPLPQISNKFKDLLLEENQDEPKISKYFLNEDFPSIIQLQKILFSEECCETKRISDESSIGDMDFSTIESGNEGNDQNISNKENEALNAQKVFSKGKISSSEIKTLLTRIFNAFNGRIPNIFRPFLYFPEYLETYFQTFEQVFLEPSAWPFQQLYQIALMTASIYQSSYVFMLFGELCQSYSGSTDYLVKGFEALEPKVKKAWDLIIFLKNNHSTTILNQSTMTSLFHKLMKQSPFWSQSEVICAILAISLSQQLSTLSNCLGLIGQYNSRSDSKKSSNSNSQNSQENPLQISQQYTKEIIQILNHEKEIDLNCDIAQEEKRVQEDIFCFEQAHSDESESAKQFKNYIGPIANESSSFSPLMLSPQSEQLSNDKTKKRRERGQLTYSTYNWNSNTVEFISSRRKDLASILNKKLISIQELTVGNFGSAQAVDTQMFRRAIWNYCEISMGYSRLDYNYKEMNTLLSKPSRQFLSKVLYRPQCFKISDINSLPCLFEPHDIVHIIFLSSESKFYTQINFLFYSLQQFLK